MLDYKLKDHEEEQPMEIDLSSAVLGMKGVNFAYRPPPGSAHSGPPGGGGSMANVPLLFRNLTARAYTRPLFGSI